MATPPPTLVSTPRAFSLEPDIASGVDVADGKAHFGSPPEPGMQPGEGSAVPADAQAAASVLSPSFEGMDTPARTYARIFQGPNPGAISGQRFSTTPVTGQRETLGVFRRASLGPPPKLTPPAFRATPGTRFARSPTAVPLMDSSGSFDRRTPLGSAGMDGSDQPTTHEQFNLARKLLNASVSPSGQAYEAPPTHTNAPVHTEQVNEMGALPRTPLEFGAPNVVSRDWMHLVDPPGRPPSLSSSDSNSEKDDTVKVLMAKIESMAKKLVDVESDMQSEALKNEMLRT